MKTTLLLASLIILSGLTKNAPAQETSEDYYHKWLMEDVLYLITPQERDVFLKLQRNEEKDSFIEEFWRRRDPTPGTSANEFKEEHYRRIAFTNAHYTSGFPGWKTDRGMIYIKFGPPDNVESHPTGGDYQRPSWEGGGSTTTYPFEKWEYRFLAGIGQDIEIEFVDDSLSGEYRIAQNPDEKDALIHTPNAGLTDAEMLGLVQQKLDRIVRKTNPMPGHNPLAAGYGRAKDQPFEKLMLLTNLERAPAVDLNPLKPEVDTQVFYNQVPFQLRYDLFRRSENKEQVVITVYLNNVDLEFRRIASTYTAKVQFYGLISDLSGRIITELEDSLATRIPASDFQPEKDEFTVFQKEAFLPAGRYKLRFFAKDLNADQLGSAEKLIVVPKSNPSRLELSSILVARRIQAVPGKTSGNEGIRYKIWPVADGKVASANKKLGFYFEIYHFRVDDISGKPQMDIRYDIVSADGTHQTTPPVFHTTEFSSHKIDVLSILKTSALKPGIYSLKIRVKDTLSGDHLERTEQFRIE